MSIVGFTLELDGDVSSFTPSVRTEMKSAIAVRAGVDPLAVELTISAGSVIADVSIQTYAVTAAFGAVDDGQRDEKPEQRNRYARKRHRRLDRCARGRDATHRRGNPTAATAFTIATSTHRTIGS